jgi:hypothetical protein
MEEQKEDDKVMAMRLWNSLQKSVGAFNSYAGKIQIDIAALEASACFDSCGSDEDKALISLNKSRTDFVNE